MKSLQSRIKYSSPSEIRDQLDSYYEQVTSIILARQNPATGLIPASVAVTTHGDYRDAWVRDNVYSIMAVWGLALAYRRIDDNVGKAYELEHATVKCMRGLLFAMMRQANKVEIFKNTQAPEHSLHAKYNTGTGGTVVGDYEWGHLQVDATSIYLLMLAQMTSSGLEIIYTLDEVNFVQNLTFYIERAYRTPDYGIWERGNKLNHGMPELNSSSIGMAVAALQAISGVNLFGARGGPSSVIHVLPDEMTRNYTTLHSALPRESYSKEVDAAVLSVISFPAFAVNDKALVDRTRNEIVKKLGGHYGCKRFLRDGHQTVVEDTSRLHYEPQELTVFEGIECEWPLFFTYLILDGLFRNDLRQAEEYKAKLEKVLVQSDQINHHHDSKESTIHNLPIMKLVPELYIVPNELIKPEKKKPGSQDRYPNENVPLVWAQSLYFLGNLISDNLLSVGELDPLGRRFNIVKEESSGDVVVQVVLLSESAELQAKLSMFGLDTQTIEHCSPVTISLPSALRDAYAFLGQNNKLGLSGRPKRPIGTLSTCKLYRCQGRLYAFLPHFMDREEFYLVSDNDYLVSVFEQELAFVKNHWHFPGRPTMVVMLTHEMIGSPQNLKKSTYGSRRQSKRNLLNLMMSLRSGVCGGVRVRLGRLSDMVNTACIESLDFLSTSDNGKLTNLHGLLKGVDQNSTEANRRLPLNEKDTLLSLISGYNGSLSATGTTTAHASANQTPVNGGPTTPGRKSRRLSTVEPDGLKSPLTSPFYTDEPLDYETITSAMTNGFNNLGLAEPIANPPIADEITELSSSIRASSPIRGVPSNRSFSGNNFTFDSSSNGRSRRKLYQFEVPSASSPVAAYATNLHTDPIPEHPKSNLDVKTKGLQLNENNGLDSAESYVSPDVNSASPSDQTLTLTLSDPANLDDAVRLLKASANLYDQVDLLHYLHSCRGPQFVVEDLGEVQVLLEEVYLKATLLKQWTIVRQAAGLLKKVVNSLTINVTDLLIRQKPVTVGFGNDEYFISSPMSPSILADIIYKYCASDVREAPLVMEVLTYLGSFIRSNPSMFDGIMRVRIHFFIIAMREEISRMRGCDEEEAVEYLMQLSPYELKSLLGQVLTAHDQATINADIVRARFYSGLKNRSILLQNEDGQKSTSPNSTNQPYANQIVITCQSAGFSAGNFAKVHLTVDGRAQIVPHVFGRGLNVMIIDPIEGIILETACFDTHISREESEEFAKLIEWLEPGMLTIVVAKDDCHENLTEAAKAACESLGSANIRQVEYRDSWCIIGERGVEKGSVPESHRPCSTGCASETIHRMIDLAAGRKKIVSSLHFGKDEGLKNGFSVPMNMILPSNGRWLRRRKNDGALNRVPKDFYPKVWKALSQVDAILIGRNSLPRNPTVNERTPEEFNFALQVEHILDVIRDPAERQIVVECLEVISRISERNPEFKIHPGTLDILKVIKDAVTRYWDHYVAENPEPAPAHLDNGITPPIAVPNRPYTAINGIYPKPIASFEKNERAARRLFFDLPQDGDDGTMAYLAQSCVKLVFDVKWSGN